MEIQKFVFNRIFFGIIVTIIVILSFQPFFTLGFVNEDSNNANQSEMQVNNSYFGGIIIPHQNNSHSPVPLVNTSILCDLPCDDGW